MKDIQLEISAEARKVLILEDNVGILDYLAALVSKGGFAPLKYSRIEDVSEILADQKQLNSLRLAILDIEIHDALSFDFYHTLRRLKPDLPVLFVSGGYYVDELMKIMSSDSSVSFLPKPFEGQDVLRVVRQPTIWGGDTSRLCGLTPPDS